MAALAAMTVVVEAAEPSGSPITADLAPEFGRELGAVPGPVTSRSRRGPTPCSSTARAVRGAQDVLDALLGVGGRARGAPARRSTGARARR